MAQPHDPTSSREPAPPYRGEGAFALWHFSEDDTLSTFAPHVPATNQSAPAQVWAVDTRHAPMFWFPRECPRGCIWPSSRTTDLDVATFFADTEAQRIHVIEASWLERLRNTRLYAYRLPSESFRPHDTVGGYWVSHVTVEAIERQTLDDLLGLHVDAEIEVRVTPSIWPWWRRVIESTLEFSGSRLANSAPHPLKIR